MVTHVGGKPFSCEICDKAYQVSWVQQGFGLICWRLPLPAPAPGCLSWLSALSAAVWGQQRGKIVQKRQSPEGEDRSMERGGL